MFMVVIVWFKCDSKTGAKIKTSQVYFRSISDDTSKFYCDYVCTERYSQLLSVRSLQEVQKGKLDESRVKNREPRTEN